MAGCAVIDMMSAVPVVDGVAPSTGSAPLADNAIILRHDGARDATQKHLHGCYQPVRLLDQDLHLALPYTRAGTRVRQHWLQPLSTLTRT